MAYEMVMPYHLHMPSYFLETFTEYPFLELDNKYNSTAGIYELDKTAKLLKNILNDSIDTIVQNKDVHISF